MKSRIISGIIAAGYLFAAYLTGDTRLVWNVIFYLMLPLACIWFSDEMGSYGGLILGHAPITRPTPGCVVALGGWVLLLLPMIMPLIVAIVWAG